MSPYIFAALEPLTDAEKLRNIVRMVSKITGVSYEGIASTSRRYNLITARFMAYKVTRELLPGLTLQQIAEVFGKRPTSHDAVLRGIYKFNDMLDTDEQVRQQYEDVKKAVLFYRHKEPEAETAKMFAPMHRTSSAASKELYRIQRIKNQHKQNEKQSI